MKGIDFFSDRITKILGDRVIKLYKCKIGYNNLVKIECENIVINIVAENPTNSTSIYLSERSDESVHGSFGIPIVIVAAFEGPRDDFFIFDEMMDAENDDKMDEIICKIIDQYILRYVEDPYKIFLLGIYWSGCLVGRMHHDRF